MQSSIKDERGEEAAPCIQIEGNECPEGGQFGWLKRNDHIQLRYAFWKRPIAGRGTIVLLPGRTEFIEKYIETIGDLLGRDFSVVIMDPRGQGLSTRLLPEKRLGHIGSFDDYLSDFVALVDEVIKPNFDAPYYLMGHSMGGHIGLRYLRGHPGFFEKGVLLSPMTSIKTGPFPPALGYAFIKGAALVLGDEQGLPGGRRADPVNAPYEANLLCRDERRYNRLVNLLKAEPSLTCGAPTLGWVKAANDSMSLIAEAAFIREIQTPLLVAMAQSDQLVDIETERRLVSILPNVTSLEVPNSQHEILMESDDKRDLFWAAFDQFLSK